MSTVLVAGQPIREGVLSMPLTGAWTLSCSLDSDEALTEGAVVTVEREDGTASLVGTVRRAGISDDIAKAQIVAGYGGLSRQLEPRAYRQASARIVASDIMADSGETLSGASDASLSSTVLAHWSRVAGTAGEALDALVAALGMVWRVLDDGSVWIGSDSWPEVEPDDAQILEEDASLRRRIVADESLSLRPGQTYGGQRIARATHHLSPERYRVELLGPREQSADPGDPVRAALAGFIARATRRIDYLALYPARVVSQAADLSLELDPDDERIPTLQGVPLRQIAPQVEVRVAAGARVLLGYEAGDPARPYASLWQSGTLTSIAIAGSSDAAALASLVLGELQKIQATLATGSNSGGPVVFGTPYVPAAVASTKLLLGS